MHLDKVEALINFAASLNLCSVIMSYKSILIQTDEKSIIITINRPEALNALNKSVFDDLEQFFLHDIKGYEDIRGIIITGSGEKAFIAGADIKEFSEFGQEELRLLSRRGQIIFSLIANCGIPVIAAVNGFALGGGCELAMACHLRIAAENAKFGQPEVNLGLTPGYGGTQRLPELVGRGRATELLLSARIIDAIEAERIGLVNKVVPIGESLQAAKDMIAILATKAPIAIAKTLQCIEDYYQPDINGYESEAARFGECGTTADFVEGTEAFIQKRKPIFLNK